MNRIFQKLCNFTCLLDTNIVRKMQIDNAFMSNDIKDVSRLTDRNRQDQNDVTYIHIFSDNVFKIYVALNKTYILVRCSFKFETNFVIGHDVQYLRGRR